MLDIAKATAILEHHFATVTPNEFAKNIREFCPELFEGEQKSSLDTELLKNEEIYRKAKEDGKLEIAPKLLQIRIQPRRSSNNFRNRNLIAS
jgi:hypothetical protein